MCNMFFNHFSLYKAKLVSFMQGMTVAFSLRSQIAAQERRNMDLAASNTSLKKANAELSAERKEFSSKLTGLKSKNEELEENYAELV